MLSPFAENSFPKSMELDNILAMLSAKLEKIHSLLIQDFGPNGVYIMTAFSGFLLLILIIYIKSVLDTFRIADGETNDAGLFYTTTGTTSFQNGIDLGFDDNQNEESHDNKHLQLTATASPVDDALEKDLSFSEKRQAALDEKDKELSKYLVESSATTDDILQLKEHLKRQTLKTQEIQLDWNKNKEKNFEKLDDETVLSYQQPQESLNELISLIINMLGRDVTPQKIAQAVYYRNKGETSEETILQSIAAVQDFISLCNTGKFSKLNGEDLPDINEALIFWAKGDNSLCLNLLENLIKQQIDKADLQTGMPKELTYAQAASYACLFGTIAGQNNLELAQNSFELALELAPKNINAWSRCGDIYWQEGNYEKAAYAYQTVSENGDADIYAAQIAHARHNLALYYAHIGQTESASQLENESQQYYDDLGIKNDLSPKESDTLEFIAENRNENLQLSITKLLQNRQTQYA